MAQVLSFGLLVESKPGTIFEDDFRAVLDDREVHLPGSATAKRTFVESGGVMMVEGQRVDDPLARPATDEDPA